MKLSFSKFQKKDFPEYKSWYQDVDLSNRLGPMDAEWLKSVLRETDGRHYSVFQEQKLIAVVGIKFPNVQYPAYYITDFAIKPTLRNKGIGSTVLQELLKPHQLKPGEIWKTFVDIQNLKAKNFFKRNGWICVSRKPDEYGMLTFEFGAQIPGRWNKFAKTGKQRTLPGKMRRFIESAWLSVLTAFILAGATTVAYALLKPTGVDVGNSQILNIMRLAGWGNGLLFGILFLVTSGVLNILRRIFRLRRVFLLHAPVVFFGVLIWFIFAWQLAGEPPYTPIARAVIPFVARPLLWGTLTAGVFALLFSFLGFFLPKK